MRTENTGFFPGFSLVMAVIGVVLMSTVHSAGQAQSRAWLLQPAPEWHGYAAAPLPEYSDVDQNMSHEWIDDRDVKSIWM